MAGCYSTPDGGEIGVQRADGPFEGRQIKKIICPNAENTFVYNDSVNYYPDDSSRRTYKLNEDEDADAKPAEVRTSDGYISRINGTFAFTTSFNCSAEGQRLLKSFDQQFINRPEGQRPSENWQGWLDATVKPIIDSNMRKIISEISCRELVSSCALVGNNPKNVKFETDDNTNAKNLAMVEQRVQEGLQAALRTQLADPKSPGDEDYFKEIRFNLEAVTLPEVEDEIANAQASFAEVASIRAEVEKEKAEIDKERARRKANFQRQKGYNSCPSCARQDELKSLPRGITTLVFGENSPVAIGR